VSAKSSELDKNSKKSSQTPVISQFEKVKAFFQDIYAEFQKITWPSLPEVIGETQRVLVLVAILTALLWVFDLAVGKIVFEPIDHLAKQVNGQTTFR
jgi:preprotein translocase SecE subunit